MHGPDFLHEFDRMVRNRKAILVEAAYGDGRTSKNLARIDRSASPATTRLYPEQFPSGRDAAFAARLGPVRAAGDARDHPT